MHVIRYLTLKGKKTKSCFYDEEKQYGVKCHLTVYSAELLQTSENVIEYF